MIRVRLSLERVAELEALGRKNAARKRAYMCDEQKKTEEVEELGEPEAEGFACPYCPDRLSMDLESLDWHVSNIHQDEEGVRP